MFFVSMFHGASHACLCRVCSTLHLTALPPMSSTFVGMSGYNVQAMRLLRSIVKGPFRPTCLCEGLSLTGKENLYQLVVSSQEKLYLVVAF